MSKWKYKNVHIYTLIHTCYKSSWSSHIKTSTLTYINFRQLRKPTASRVALHVEASRVAAELEKFAPFRTRVQHNLPRAIVQAVNRHCFVESGFRACVAYGTMKSWKVFYIFNRNVQHLVLNELVIYYTWFIVCVFKVIWV